jgi:ketosteroid isomerase-like protein
MPIQEENIIREVSAAWGRSDLPTLMKYIAPDCVYCASVGTEPGETFTGRAEVERGFKALLAHDSDGVAEPGEMRSVGDWVVSTWGFRKKSPAGEPILVRGCDIFVLRDGLIVRKDSFRKSYK